MLTELTPDQEALCEAVANEYLDDFMKPTPPDRAVIDRWLTVVYKLYDLPVPARIEIADSPMAALALASTLTGSQQVAADGCGLSDCGWVAFYDYFHRINVLTDAEASDVLALRNYMRVAWDSVLLDECAIIIRRPTTLKLDETGNLHCSDGPCLEWADGERDFAWHGTWVPERIVMDPRSHTKEEYLAITNTEIRRALSEAAGWAWVTELLGATTVDTWTDPDTSLAYELLRCSNGQQLLRKQSPMLADGSQPSYIEPVHEALRTAQASRKWQATGLSAEDCEKDPVLHYTVEA